MLMTGTVTAGTHRQKTQMGQGSGQSSEHKSLLHSAGAQQPVACMPAASASQTSAVLPSFVRAFPRCLVASADRVPVWQGN